MGWIELHRKPGEDDKAFFANELGPGFVVEDASRNRGEEAVYLAIRYASGEWEGKTVAMVALYSESPSRFRYTIIEEGLGPFARSCPPHILDRLSPVEELYPEGSFGREHAARWRKMCRG